jgi:putative transposase
LLERIEAIHDRSRQTFGSPRGHAQLAVDGHRVSRGRVERLMRGTPPARGLPAPALADRGRGSIGRREAPHLVERDFTASAPTRLWVADFTYVRTRQEFLYLASADHGSKSTSLAFSQRLADAGIAASMGSVGGAYDNAMIESFRGIIKTELLYRQIWAPATRRICRSSSGSRAGTAGSGCTSALGYRSPQSTSKTTTTRPSQPQQPTNPGSLGNRRKLKQRNPAFEFWLSGLLAVRGESAGPPSLSETGHDFE